MKRYTNVFKENIVKMNHEKNHSVHSLSEEDGVSQALFLIKQSKISLNDTIIFLQRLLYVAFNHLEKWFYLLNSKYWNLCMLYLEDLG